MAKAKKPTNREKIEKQKGLVSWLKNKIKKGINKIKVIGTRSGGFYAFKYRSKLYHEFTTVKGKKKRRLEYYDEQPLILMISKGGGYMLGVNFHYLPPKVRERVLTQLKKRYKSNFDDNKQLTNLKWKNIAKQLSYSDIMVKLYIEKNISSIVKIKNTEMEKMIDLPSEKFIGISSKKLWRSLGLS